MEYRWEINSGANVSMSSLAAENKERLIATTETSTAHIFPYNLADIFPPVMFLLSLNR